MESFGVRMFIICVNSYVIKNLELNFNCCKLGSLMFGLLFHSEWCINSLICVNSYVVKNLELNCSCCGN